MVEVLAQNAIVGITDKDEVSSRVDKDAIEEHLAEMCRELIAVPHERGVADAARPLEEPYQPALLCSLGGRPLPIRTYFEPLNFGAETSKSTLVLGGEYAHEPGCEAVAESLSPV